MPTDIHSTFQCLEKVIKLIAKVTKSAESRDKLKDGDVKTAMTLHAQRTAEKQVELKLCTATFWILHQSFFAWQVCWRSHHEDTESFVSPLLVAFALLTSQTLNPNHPCSASPPFPNTPNPLCPC